MATLDEELRMDAEEDAREADFILSQLPSDLKERFTKEEILRLMDLIVEYYYESGVLDLDDDEIEIDLEQVADAICKKAKKEGLGDYQADEVFFVVQADLDYQEQTL
ncbi:hypothetical protein SAMN04487851_101292 [Prevotella sp. tc2-28]|jgi:hypothetical protein|uniref:hypothetical protein n=1 Tax=Prevotella sp. tc2-28 TaxID=1761888 RepID=UPI000896C673|nr:hypothetical protein [Prevotella sp. tc2-28]SDZ96353.1 hypothetical protein SAMN04487851_101292 [Prevotella sp. tc2-28]